MISMPRASVVRRRARLVDAMTDGPNCSAAPNCRAARDGAEGRRLFHTTESSYSAFTTAKRTAPSYVCHLPAGRRRRKRHALARRGRSRGVVIPREKQGTKEVKAKEGRNEGRKEGNSEWVRRVIIICLRSHHGNMGRKSRGHDQGRPPAWSQRLPTLIAPHERRMRRSDALRTESLASRRLYLRSPVVLLGG